MWKINLILIVGLIAICRAEESDSDTFHFFDHDYDRTQIGNAVDKASMKLLKETYDAANVKNVIASPLGAFILLSMYAAGAGNNTKQEITKALGSDNYDELYKAYTGMSTRFSEIDANYLTLSNKVFISDKRELNDEYSNGPVRSYHSEIEKVDFGHPPVAVAAINRWAEEKTKGHIKEAVSEKSIDASVVAALVNVIFFQGKWHVPFNASNTQEKDFHVDKNTVVKKPMMHLYQSLFYHESSELDAKLIELPYQQKGFRMVIVLPNEIDGLPALMEKVKQRGILTDVFSLEPAGRDIVLDMPKFDIKSELNLNDLLPKVGISSIFSEPASGIVNGGAVVVSKAFQKAFVKVNEEGATAGAFTGLVIVPVSSISQPPPPLHFTVDHPFLFAILHEDILLFTGTYSQ